MGRDGKVVRVLFVAHPSRKQVAVPAASLVVEQVRTWPDASRYLEMSAPTRTKSSKPAKKKLAAPDRTRDEALQLFKTKFPGGFEDPQFVETERKPRLQAHELYAQTLGGGELARLVAAGDAKELAERAKKVETATTLLFRLERNQLHAALQDAEPTVAFFGALATLLDAEDRGPAFDAFVKALQAFPSPKGRLATWAVATVFPFLAKPDTFVFVKPTPTKEVASRYALDILYKPAPSWETYAQVLKLAGKLREDLDPLGCRDLVDVQAFIAVTTQAG
jgi:hypothetical protein